MKKIYHLTTCQTCKKILAETKPGRDCELQNIKEIAITAEELDAMKTLAGSYDVLFSKRSQKYRAWNLQGKNLTESDKHDLILKEYTFLKRPVAIIGKRIFIGNASATISELKKALRS